VPVAGPTHVPALQTAPPFAHVPGVDAIAPAQMPVPGAQVPTLQTAPLIVQFPPGNPPINPTHTALAFAIQAPGAAQTVATNPTEQTPLTAG